MYEARSLIVKILKLIMKREDVKKQLEDAKSGEAALESYEELTSLSERIIKQYRALEDEHRIFKRPLVFNKADYIDEMYDDALEFKNTLEKEF